MTRVQSSQNRRNSPDRCPMINEVSYSMQSYHSYLIDALDPAVAAVLKLEIRQNPVTVGCPTKVPPAMGNHAIRPTLDVDVGSRCRISLSESVAKNGRCNVPKDAPSTTVLFSYCLCPFFFPVAGVVALLLLQLRQHPVPPKRATATKVIFSC